MPLWRVAGLAGCIAMDLVSYFWAHAKSPPAQFLIHHGTRPDVASSQANPSVGDLDIATAKLAKKLAKPLLDRELSREEQDQGGKVVHYAYGASMGAIYGVSGGRLGLREYGPVFVWLMRMGWWCSDRASCVKSGRTRASV